jgi:phage shock protein PspC (stress-responsive transcriptional regulator)
MPDKLIHKLYRSRTDRQLEGVCGGCAAYFNYDSSLVRILTVVATCLTGFFPGVIAYIVCAVIIPLEPPSIESQ